MRNNSPQGMLENPMGFGAYDHLDDATVVCDEDGTCVYANPAAEALYGDAPPGTRLADLFQPREAEVSCDDLSFAKKAAYRRACIHRTRPMGDVSVVWVLKWLEGSPGKYLSISRVVAGDTSEEKSRDSMRKLLDAMPDIALFVDPDHKIVVANQALAQVLNTSVERLEGELATARFPNHLKEMRSAAFEMAKGQRRPVRFEEQRENKHFLTTVSPTFGTDSAFTGAAICSVDVSELKVSHGRRLELEERLSQTERLESIGRLAGGIAHDFNNLLMGILGFVELSLGEVDEKSTVHSNLISIQEAGEHAADLTRRLLIFSRRQVIEPKVVDLNVVVEETQALLGRVIGEDVELSFLPMKRAAMVRLDPTQINQILMNLATNARDAMPKGGRLTLALSQVMVDEEFCRLHPGLMTGQHIQLAVSDSGVGMPDEAIEKAFEPFFTTKPRDRGTGLGLSTVHGIVNQNGGVIAVYSEVDVGTTFKIYLPVTTDAPDAPLSKAPPPIPRNNSGIKVLLVEDEPLVREVAHSILARSGFEVLEAADGRAALQQMKLHDDISVLLTDVIMPDMNGKDLFNRLREVKEDLECVFMSGYTDHVIVPHGVLEPGVAFLEKPFSAQTLIAKIHEVLNAPTSVRAADMPP